MPNAQEKFIDQVTDGFGDDLEKKHNARELLKAQLSDEDGAFEKAKAQLEKSVRRPKWLSLVVSSLIVLLGFLIIIYSGYSSGLIGGPYAGSTIFDVKYASKTEAEMEVYFRNLSEQDRLLLFGDTRKKSNADREKALWLVEPKNAGAYIEYIQAYKSERGAYPVDMLQVAEEIDPDNGIYSLFLALDLSRGSSKQELNTSEDPKNSGMMKAGARMRVVTNLERHNESLNLLRNALAQSQCTYNRRGLKDRRMTLLQKSDADWLMRDVPSRYYYLGLEGGFNFFELFTLIETEVYRCTQEQDVEGLGRVSRDWIALCRSINAMSEHLWDIGALNYLIQESHKKFVVAAKACGLVEMEKSYTALGLKIANDRVSENKFNNTTLGEYRKWQKKSGVSSVGMLSRGFINPSIKGGVLALDTRPERLSDHAFWNRLVLVAHWLLLLLIALVTWVYTFCSDKLSKRVAGKMAGAFGMKDWLFTAGFGVFLPVAIYWLVNGTRTELSVQNWYLGYKNYALPVGQSISLLLLLLLAPILVTAHQLQKMLPLKERERMFTIWIAVGLALLSMPVFGLAMVLDTDGRVVVKLGYAMQVMSLLLLLLTPVIGFAMRQYKGEFGIIHHVRHRLLVKVYVIASLVMVAQIPVYHMLERHWVGQDEGWNVGPDDVSVTKHTSIMVESYLRKMEKTLDELEAKP